MGSGYYGSGSSSYFPKGGGGYYSGGSSGSSQGGLFGFIAHLGADIKDAAFGIPGGLVNLAEHPIGSIKAMAKSTWHDWSPLFHGEFHKEWTQFLAHPLAPLLDLGMAVGVAGAPFTAGTSLETSAEASLAREALAIGDIGKMGDAISQSARIIKIPAARKFLGGETNRFSIVRYHAPLGGDVAVPALVKELSGNPLIRMRQVELAKLGGRLSDSINSWFGRDALRPGLTGGLRATAAFERALSGREVSFQANKELTAGHAQAVVDEARQMLSQHTGIDPSVLSDYEVASHAQVSRFVQAGQWLAGKTLGVAPSEIWNGLLKWQHGQLLAHPMYVVGEQDLKGMLKQGFIGVKAEFPGMSTADTFEGQMKAASTVGKKGFLTRVPERMAKDAQGRYLLVPHHAAFNWMREGVNSASFLKSLFRNPARVWKLTQVAWSPKTVMNTSVGNSFMLLMGQPRAFLHLVDGIRLAKGGRAAEDMLRKTGDFQPGVLREHFADVLHSSNAAAKAGISPLSDVGGISEKLGVFKKMARTGFYGGVHKVEQGLKAGSVVASLHSAPEIKALMRSGKSFEDAAQQALRDNPALRDRVARTALLHIGNYETFSKREQKLKNFVPFYSWDRHIVLHTVNMLAQQPVRAVALASVGNQGSALFDKAMPGVPVYMRTNLPLAALGIASNKTLDTIGLNPYSSAADLAGAAIGLTVGSRAGPEFAPSEDTAGQLSPLITGVIQGVTGHSILTDKALPNYGGPISTAAVNVFNNLPQVKIARLAAMGAGHPTHAPLYADTMQRLLSKYIGVPIQEPNLQAAQAVEATINKGKKKKSYYG